ncbi:MAG: hypothetical protein Kow0069_15220 [Promethearchaeota archaeon]
MLVAVLVTYVLYVPVGLFVERGVEGLASWWSGRVYSNYHHTFRESLLDGGYFFGEVPFSLGYALLVAGALLYFGPSDDVLRDAWYFKGVRVAGGSLKPKVVTGVALSAGIYCFFVVGAVVGFVPVPAGAENNPFLLTLGDPEAPSRQLLTWAALAAGWAYLPYALLTYYRPSNQWWSPDPVAYKFLAAFGLFIALLLAAFPLEPRLFLSSQLTRDLAFQAAWSLVVCCLVFLTEERAKDAARRVKGATVPESFDLGLAALGPQSSGGASPAHPPEAGARSLVERWWVAKYKTTSPHASRYRRVVRKVAYVAVAFLVVLLVAVVLAGTSTEVGVYRLLQRVFPQLFQLGLVYAFYYGGLYLRRWRLLEEDWEELNAPAVPAGGAESPDEEA